ncbi:hypothetical protein PCASD_26552 [Puccinia coronata f. sp. avenae]|uniref:Uncharacterized protein n=1 Tax=Puccinia coronata f. sp. avenae TaxID=200324 RepID=A0A2N5TR69_9BASI|nr:hypothetical protein PCASD_26552 [Puccinia coronata f. sp. avenae]
MPPAVIVTHLIVVTQQVMLNQEEMELVVAPDVIRTRCKTKPWMPPAVIVTHLIVVTQQVMLNQEEMELVVAPDVIVLQQEDMGLRVVAGVIGLHQ